VAPLQAHVLGACCPCLTAARFSLTNYRGDVRSGALGPALTTILEDKNGSFRAAANRMRGLAAIAGRRSKDAAADLLEMALNYGWSHLMPPSSRMPWWAASNADVIAVCAAAAAAVLGTLAAAAVMLTWRARGGGKREGEAEFHAKKRE
jgi:hypothetical protein